MPTFRNITVEVTDEHNIPLQEYGTRRSNRAHDISCYIQSDDQMPFRIRIAPQLPFPYPEEDPNAPPPRTEDWHFLATLRLDGRKRYEKLAAVYLNPEHPEFNWPDGEVIIKRKYVRDHNGVTRTQGWVFKEVDLEAFMQLLVMSDEHADTSEKENKDRAASPSIEESMKLLAMSGDNNTEASAKENNDPSGVSKEKYDSGVEEDDDRLQFGKIEITLERVTYDNMIIGRPDLDVMKELDVNMSSKDMTTIAHTVARHGGQEVQPLTKTVRFTPLKTGERPYAVFRFLYRSEAILRKLKPRGFLPEEKTKSPGNDALATAAANPLGGKEDDGVAQDQPDEGIAGLLGKVNLGSKRECDDEASQGAEGTNGSPKATKMAKKATSDDEATPGGNSTNESTKARETKKQASSGEDSGQAGGEEDEEL